MFEGPLKGTQHEKSNFEMTKNKIQTKKHTRTCN